MNILRKTISGISGTVRSASATLNRLTGGVSVNTQDVPMSPVVLDSLSLKDVESWMHQNLAFPDEPVKVAVVRARHEQIWRVTFVVLNGKNKRCLDDDGRLRASSRLVRGISKELEEFLGSNSTVLIAPRL